MAHRADEQLQAQRESLGAVVADAEAAGRSPVAALVGWLRDRRRALAEHVLQADAHDLVAALAQLMDVAVCRIHDLALEQACGGTPAASPIALVATGGYGRRQLCPFSDVDVALVTGQVPQAEAGQSPADLDPLVKVTHRLIVEVLGDGLGLEVGYAYRPVHECTNLDHPTQTALLDSRFVAGDEALFADLRRALVEGLDRLGYMQAKAAETAARRAKFGDSPYYLEPDVKNSAGGLRDLQTLRWTAAARFGVHPTAALEELERRRIISRHDREALLAAEGFLLKVRCWLHFFHDGHADVLFRSKGRELADAFDRLGEASLSSVQGLMSHYYQCAATILSTAERGVQHCVNSELDLGDGFVARQGQLRAADPHLFQKSPTALVRAFELAQRYGLRMAEDLREQIRASLNMVDEGLRTSPGAAQHFRAILRAPARVADTLGDMWEIGLLPLYLPELAGLELLVPPDPTHELTVGAHTLRTIANLEAIPSLATAPYDQLRAAYADVQKKDLLVLACLLHDAGKVEPQADHCQVGSRLAAQVARRLGFSGLECGLAADLVRKHLLLVRTARLQDITLPATVASFAQSIESADLLNMLYVLSYADTAAVGPGALTDVSRQQADDLYFQSLRSLLSEGATSLAGEHVRRVRQEAERRLRAGGKLGDAAISRHFEGMPSSYMLSNAVGAIAEHISFVERIPAEGLVVDFYNESGKQFTELTICCRDDPEPGLFAKIAGTLYANDVSIHAAQLYTREGDDIVLDLLWVDYQGRQVAEAKQESICRDLRAALAGGGSVSDLLAQKHRPAPEPLASLSIRANNALDRDHTVIQLVAADQAGLLYKAAQAMASLGLDIHSARITTWRGMAEDAFYVKGPDGGPLTDDRAAEVEDQLTDLLARR